MIDLSMETVSCSPCISMLCNLIWLVSRQVVRLQFLRCSDRLRCVSQWRVSFCVDVCASDLLILEHHWQLLPPASMARHGLRASWVLLDAVPPRLRGELCIGISSWRGSLSSKSGRPRTRLASRSAILSPCQQILLRTDAQWSCELCHCFLGSSRVPIERVLILPGSRR